MDCKELSKRNKELINKGLNAINQVRAEHSIEPIKEGDIEVEQLERWEIECIYRHLNMFIQTQWDRKANVPDACYGCKRYCNDNEIVLDPWPTFYKLADLSQSSKVDEKVIPNKQDNDHIYL